MTVLDVWEYIRVGGIPALLFVILVASMQGRFVWRREHDALEERRAAEGAEWAKRLEKAEGERDRWEQAFLRVAGVAESVTELAASRSPAGGAR